MANDTSPPTATVVSHQRRIGGMLLALTAAEAILLFLNTGVLLLAAFQNQSYNDLHQQPNALQVTIKALSVLGLLSFALPPVLGALARSWRAAVTLPILAVWLALILTVISTLIYTPQYLYYLPSISYALSGTANSGLIDYWLNPVDLLVLPFAFLLFGALGWVGFIARRALANRD